MVTPISPNASLVWWRGAWAVAVKDFRSEWRSRAAFNAIALFSLAAPVALGYALTNLKLEPETLGGLLWTTLFFAAMVGLPRAFVKEEESGTAALLRLHYSAQSVLWGKVTGQLVLLLFNAKVSQPFSLLAILLGGDIGLAISSCIVGAMAAQARARGALFPALAAPLLLPLLATLSVATGFAFGAVGDVWPALKVIVAFDVALLAASWILFDFVWE